MTTPLFFDIETGPLPPIEVEQFKPEFRAPANYKDLDKIKANLLEQEAKWLADGALSAVTGRLLCFGFTEGDLFEHLGNDDEKVMLETAMDILKQRLQAGGLVVGFCCKTFDLPFLIRRCWRHGVYVPRCLFEGHRFSPFVYDVAEKWACGGREPRDRISLDHLSKFLGTGAKNGEGSDFAKLWAEDRSAALDYLKCDLELTRAAYERLFVQ